MDEQQTNVKQGKGKRISDDNTTGVVEATTQVKSKKHVCMYCARQFSQLYVLKRHIRTHTGETPFKCSTCGKAFSVQRSLKEHELDHIDTRPFLCTTCGKQFKRSHELKNHKRVHTGERPFSCSECGKVFGHATTLLRHSRIHSDERPHICGACNQSFRQVSSLKRHMQSHNDTHPYRCEGCNECFRQLRDSQLHICQSTDLQQTVTASHSTKVLLKCMFCSKEYKSRVGLVYHIKMKHSVVGESASITSSYTCDICSKVLDSVGGLATHRRTHSDERPFVCNICGNRFSDKAHLRRHEKQHTGERITCVMCHRGFISRWQVRRHLRQVHRLSADATEDAMAMCKHCIFNVDGTGIEKSRPCNSKLLLAQKTTDVKEELPTAPNIEMADCEQMEPGTAVPGQLSSQLCYAVLNTNNDSDFPCETHLHCDNIEATDYINHGLPEHTEGSREKQSSFYAIDDTEQDIAWLTSVDSTIEQCDYAAYSDIDALIAGTTAAMPETEKADTELTDNHIVVSVNGQLLLLDMIVDENWLAGDLLENGITKGD